MYRHHRLSLDADHDVAARGVDLIGEGERHRASDGRAFQIAIEGGDARNARNASRRQNLDRHAGLNFAARDKPAITAKILVWPADPLDRHAKRLPLGRANGLYIFQIFKQ